MTTPIQAPSSQWSSVTLGRHGKLYDQVHRTPSEKSCTCHESATSIHDGDESHIPNPITREVFQKAWTLSTEDQNITLYSFRRFKTSHLVNLRLLEHEIAQIDHQIYQTGLNLGIGTAPNDRLGLEHCKRDKSTLDVGDIIKDNLILRLRDLLSQYGFYAEMSSVLCEDESLIAFNKIMLMETGSKIDGLPKYSFEDDTSLYEIYKTRLLRVDRGPRKYQDPFQRGLNKCLRWYRYRTLSVRQDREEGTKQSDIRDRRYQDTVVFAETICRIIVALAANVFILVPLAILSYQPSKRVQLIVVTVWVVVFSFLVSTIFKASNQATLAVIAAYAAVLSVFISNSIVV
ncbi:hypothetical protein BX600DRAFT_435617 [Xylariales sp. PMI_506]|nr:hypothetical protein BX600DRAFT_435617 [Xylariales sp. PMI_506]